MTLNGETIRRKREGHALAAAEIDAFVRGLTDGGWTDAQVGAMAMAIVWRGMTRQETVHLTEAMTRSGRVMDWQDLGLDAPVLDKHSTGGVGDKVSLMLAPTLAACGALVPMISGRGLGHTGGTLDKLEALPGYRVDPGEPALREALRTSGCAIVGASADLAPADRRLYAIRDVTATVESLPLITASILSKKLAAGLQGLVLDVKFGSGAFTPQRSQARELAEQLVAVAAGAGLRAEAWLTDMDQPLGRTAGGAVEVREAIDFLLRPDEAESRLREVTLALSARLLCLGRLAEDDAAARARVERAWHSGAAAERLARMVAALGGPADVLRDAQLPTAPVVLDAPALQTGTLVAIDTRAVGLVVAGLGGGRQRPQDAVDPRVGLAALRPLGSVVERGAPLAQVHAATRDAAQRAIQALQQACRIDPSVAAWAATPVVLEGVCP